MTKHEAPTHQLQRDIYSGFLGGTEGSEGLFKPRLVLNQDGRTVEHTLVEELRRGGDFTFSVAFVTAGAIAQLKQHFRDSKGKGRIVTSDFLGFNHPRAFEELLNLRDQLGIDVRRHLSAAFHAKGYVFDRAETITAMIGSSNLTNRALSQNEEWNIKVSAAAGSGLAIQLKQLLEDQMRESEPLTRDWVDEYAETYEQSEPRLRVQSARAPGTVAHSHVEANLMQREALFALEQVRAQGARRAVIVSATGTGKTMLSALDVRAVNPDHLLFIVHREQILRRTIAEYARVLGGHQSDYGLLTGSSHQGDRKYVFATIQTLSQSATLATIPPDAFDYIIIDEAHRAGAGTYQRAIQHFQPKFLLGMTATPERTDGFNVFELFDYNVPYEIRLSTALKAEMLCPFHYYGISDVAYSDDSMLDEDLPLGLLISADRVEYLVKSLALYGQAGVAPRGLIFCSRREEARELSDALNATSLRGRPLRTVALTGADSMETREQRVRELESGELDYILTVDVFNEGIDIPSINQVVMLRQTQSAIVFVQQLGRGLRLAEGKDYLTVIDFIGNYANNFMVPIALFGEDSLNRESLRERLNETVDAGALPGLSSVSFDEIARDRVLRSIAQAKLDSMASLRVAMNAMRNRVGGVPLLWDFYRFRSVDPVLLATKRAHYPDLVRSLLQVPPALTPPQSSALELLTHEVLTAKRLQEFVLLELLLSRDSVSEADIRAEFEKCGLSSSFAAVASSVDTLALAGYSQSDLQRYRVAIAQRTGSSVSLSTQFKEDFESSGELQTAIRDLLRTGRELTKERYLVDQLFTQGMQYSRRDAAHIIGWPRSFSSTIFGYKTDESSGFCLVFVTLHKSSDVDASTAYQDQLIDPSTMRWFSRSRRSLRSREVSLIVDGQVQVHVFVKKDDAEGSDHYYLGRADAHESAETTMPDSEGNPLPVVRMLLKFRQPIKQGLFDYFHAAL